MRILLVGALSWNPERIRSLREQGHQLWGLWSRSTAWDQGPYPEAEGCVRQIGLCDAAETIRQQGIDCVYSLFQIYHPRLWGPPTPGVAHDAWTLLRTLMLQRQGGAFDAPIVRHWGFDVQNLDPEVARGCDGHLFCNREKLGYWSAPPRQGGCGLDVFDRTDVRGFLDSDRPKLEFMHDRFAEPLSAQDGEIHTVCVGRPFNLDYISAAEHGIHVHLYGNSVDNVYRTIARDLSARQARKSRRRLTRFLHVHPSLQTVRGQWADVQRRKAGWVEEFSRYDAGWSYVGSPLPWPGLDDRAAIPNRVGTYLLAGLPIITDRRPGFYRHDLLRGLGVDIELVDSDYAALRSGLETEIRTREKQTHARKKRHGYSYEVTIEPLLRTLESAQASYFASPPAERRRFLPKSRREVIHFHTSPAPRAVLARLLAQPASERECRRSRRLLARLQAAWGQRRLPLVSRRAQRLRRTLLPGVEDPWPDARSRSR
jgi:hypothetical protein